MPGVGVRTAARILLDVGDASLFPTAGHLAAYAGLAPVTHRSGTSIRGEFPATIGKQAPQTGPVPVIVRRAQIRSRQQGLLRPETSPRQETQRRTHLPLPAPSRRPVRHAQKPRALPGPQPDATTPRSLTRNIGTPPIGTSRSATTPGTRTTNTTSTSTARPCRRGPGIGIGTRPSSTPTSTTRTPTTDTTTGGAGRSSTPAAPRTPARRSADGVHGEEHHLVGVDRRVGPPHLGQDPSGELDPGVPPPRGRRRTPVPRPSPRPTTGGPSGRWAGTAA